MNSPARRLLFERLPFSFPFRDTSARNVLEDFTGDDNPELKVLFLGCGDLQNPLAAVNGSPPDQTLHLHINDRSLLTIARNILILKIISSPEFNPEDDQDLGYIWDLWYNATWNKATLDRFKGDVKILLDEQHPAHIIIPKVSYQEDLADVWRKWLSMPHTMAIGEALADRTDFMTDGWSRFLKPGYPVENGQVVPLNKAVDHAVQRLVQVLVSQAAEESVESLWNENTREKIAQELREYFETGNTGPENARETVNPTLFRPDTRQWTVYYSASPFNGYFPLPLKDLEGLARAGEKRIAYSYCRNELKKLLIAFRKRMDKLKFVFHPCDALALCYEDSPDVFEVIDTSTLADHVGLVNLLNAASRKLRSDQSVLFTESIWWTNVAPDLAHYVQEVLCCPLSLIPTLYGLRLTDNIELGPESFRRFDFFTGSPSRLRWKKALPFEGVPLVLSPPLERSLTRLMTHCFLTPPNLPMFNAANVVRTSGMTCYSPLTFHYVLSDLFIRGGVQDPSGAIKTFLSGRVPPVFRKSVEAIQAWMDNESVWRVKIRMEFCENLQKIHDIFLRFYSGECVPLLRLVLIPDVADFVNVISSPDGYDDMRSTYLDDLNAEGHHFVDNLEVSVEWHSPGRIRHVDVTFLLKDLGLLSTHHGVMFDDVMSVHLFFCFLSPPTIKKDQSSYKRDLFRPDRPYPFAPLVKPPALAAAGSSSDGSPRLIAASCRETEESYVLRFKIPSAGTNPRQIHPGRDCELTVTMMDDEWPCESAHRITISLDGLEPVTITLPHPVLLDNLKAILRDQGGVVEVVVTKALKDLWQEDVIQEELRWNVENLEPWTDWDSLKIHHLDSHQFEDDAHEGDVEASITRVREIIRTLFLNVVQGQLDFQVELEGSPRSPNWLLRAHPPILTSPRGAPILLLSALDRRLVEGLQTSEAKFEVDDQLTADDAEFHRVFEGLDDSVVILSLRTAEEVRLFRFILRLNSVKILPTPWQKENFPQGDPGLPWLATFVQPLYLDADPNYRPEGCDSCGDMAEALKPCGRCKAVAYCSAKCQRAGWPEHKPFCSKV